MDESCTTSYSDNSSSNSSQLENSQIILSTNLILPLPADEERRNLSDKNTNIQVHEKSELKRMKILRFTSRAFAACCFCCCSHAGQPGAVLQHCYTAAQTIKKSFTGKNLDVFQTKPLKLAATGCARTSRTRFPSCHAYQFRVVVEIWNFGGVELVARCVLGWQLLGSPAAAAAAAAASAAQLRKWRSLCHQRQCRPARILASDEASLFNLSIFSQYFQYILIFFLIK